MNKYYAKFNEDGERETSIVLNVHFTTEDELQPYLALGFVPISEEEQELYCTGMYIRGTDGKPVLRVLTIDELKAAKWAEIKTKRDTLEQSGVPYLGKIIDSDTISVQRIAIAVQAAQAAINAGIDFTLDWTCADNTVLTMTAAEVVGMSVALAQHADSLHQTARGLRERIEAATTAEELAAIKWPE